MSDNALTIQAKNQHLPNWQTLKLILSSLIVFNFYLNIVPSVKSDYSILINLFDLVLIPMFVFIAAYTSRGISWQNWRAHLIPPLIIYVTFQSIDAIPLYFTNRLSVEEYLLFPQNGVWFFLAVPIWQAIFLLLPPFIKNKARGVFLILLLSLGIAYVSKTYLSDITGFSSIIWYFPFFVMAYFCDDKKVLWLRQHAFSIVSSVIMLVTIYLYFQVEIESGLINVFGSHLFIHHFCLYVFAFLIGVLISIAIICLSLSTERFVKIANNALGVYLIHPIICFVLLAGLGSLEIDASLPLLILLALFTIALALFLAKNRIIHWFLNPEIKLRKE
ncbi:TPA: acyltransferase family protein [Providencia alcalifaciens]